MRKILTLISTLFISFSSFSQINDEDLSEANRLKKLFTEDRVAATLLEEEYTFDKGKGTDNLPVLSATKNTSINFISLRERAGIQYFDFYNSFSKINSFKQLERLRGAFGIKKNYNVGYAIDRSVTSNEIFSDDSRVKYFNIGFSGYGDVTRVETEKKFF